MSTIIRENILILTEQFSGMEILEVKKLSEIMIPGRLLRTQNNKTRKPTSYPSQAPETNIPGEIMVQDYCVLYLLRTQ